MTEQIFLANLALIDRIVAALARRHQLQPDDAAEFGAWARSRILENDYAVFRKFGGRSSLATYLTVVLTNLYRDYRNAQWGRWRPSAAARRLGPVGIRLEALTARDGHPVREAVRVLHSTGVSISEHDLIRMAQTLPCRRGLREIQLGDGVESEPRIDGSDPALAAEAREEAGTLERKLSKVLQRLAPEDQLILRMRYWDGFTVASIARTLHLDQKALYRRIDAIQRSLKKDLESDGVSQGSLDSLLGAMTIS